jgi:hypothetical protein
VKDTTTFLTLAADAEGIADLLRASAAARAAAAQNAIGSREDEALPLLFMRGPDVGGPDTTNPPTTTQHPIYSPASWLVAGTTKRQGSHSSAGSSKSSCSASSSSGSGLGLTFSRMARSR